MSQPDTYTIRLAMETERVLQRAQMIRAYAEELLRRPYRPALPPLIPVPEEAKGTAPQ